MTSWWARAISFRLLVWWNCSDMSCDRCGNQHIIVFQMKIWRNSPQEYRAREDGNKKFHVYSKSTWPKVYPAPRGDIPQPQRSSGSDHKRSHMAPSWGTSWTRSKLLTLSRVSIDGDSPPCKQKISDST